MSKSKLNSDTVLPPVVTVHPYSPSLTSSGSISRDFADVPTPVCVGRIIYDMLPCSASNENESSRSWLKVWPSSQVPPRLVVVNPTPHLTPPASPISASVFTSASFTSPHNNNHNGFGGTKGNCLTLPPNNYPNRIQDPQTPADRSRSDSVPTTAVTATDINFVSSSSLSLPQSLQPQPHHQSVDEDQLLTSSQSFVQDLEIPANSNSNRHSISSTTTIASATDSTTSAAISTATAATSVFFDEASEVEEPRKTVNGDMWINDAPVVGSPMDDVDVQPMSKAEGSGPSMTLRLDSLSTIHSMSVRKGGDQDEDSADDLEELDGLDGATRLINVTSTTAAAATKKKTGIRKKVKTKTKPLKRNSLRSPTSTLSPPLPAALHSTSSSLTNVSSKRPVKLNIIESNIDDGSGVGSNSANGSRVSGAERLNPLQQEGDFQPYQLGIIQQQDTVPHHHPAPHHHSAPHHHPAPHHHHQLKSEKELDHQITREGVVAEPQLQKEEKGKGREHSNPNTNSNSKHSTHETLNMVSSALAAKVKHTLADPLLPGQHKRTIVLTTSESEYEHSDDGSWSSEEMGSEDEEVSFLLLRCIFFTLYVWNLISPFFILL
jgi:hypothetical protein